LYDAINGVLSWETMTAPTLSRVQSDRWAMPCARVIHVMSHEGRGVSIGVIMSLSSNHDLYVQGVRPPLETPEGLPTPKTTLILTDRGLNETGGVVDVSLSDATSHTFTGQL
jgi:hypothetical protein